MREKNAPDQSMARKTWHGTLSNRALKDCPRDTHPIYSYHSPFPFPTFTVWWKEPGSQEDGSYYSHDHDWDPISVVVYGLPQSDRGART
jgi:hypothetical protein